MLLVLPSLYMKICDPGIMDYCDQDVLEKSVLLPKKEFYDLCDNILGPDKRSIIHEHQLGLS
jgi:hypothetical protein